MMTEKAALYTAKRDSGIDSSTVTPAWLECRNSNEQSWILVGFDDAVKDKLVIKYSGTNGASGMIDTFQSNEGSILFGAVPFTVDGNKKYAFITWCGPSVGALKKGKVSLQKQGVYNIFEGIIGDVGILNSKEDVTLNNLQTLISKSTNKKDVQLS